MRPNKFGCTWLGQGGALKVVSEGFGSAMMLKEFFFGFDDPDFFAENG